GSDDILVGSPVAGRLQPQFREIVGYFVNLVVLRGDLSKNPSFREFLNQISQTVNEALTHQNYPFALLVEKLQPQRDSSRSPIFQASFALQQLRQSRNIQNFFIDEIESNIDWGGLKLRAFEIPQQEGQNDLDLEVFEGSSSIKGSFKYNTNLFDSQTIERMVAHFQNLLEGIVENPLQEVGSLNLLSEWERHQLLGEWNDTVTDYPKYKCIHQLFEEQVEKTPLSIAVVFEEEQLTYEQLNQRANQLAHHLQTLGVKPEVLVGICVEHSIEMVVGLLGILKAGGAYVPIDPNYPQERISYMLKDSAVGVLLTQNSLLESLPEHNARVVCLDSDWDEIEQYSQENLDIGVDSDNLAYVIYTSGSTGKPKGAMNSHQGIHNRLLWMQDTYQLNTSDRVLQKTPFSFDVSVWEFFWPLLTGASIVVAKPEGHKDTTYLVNLISSQQITTIHFVPSMLQVFLQSANKENCNSLKRVFCSGEALPFELTQLFFSKFECELHNLYGPTEAAIDVTFWQCKPQSNLQI
ncbi:MAG: AMP-binding protein, partial [Cyanobacteria bacterium P01_H01_bin.150]